MTTDELINKILENTFTLNKLKSRLPLLKEFLTATFFSSADQFKKDLTAADLAWLDSLGSDFYHSFDKNNLTQTLAQIETYLSSIKPLVLYLPIIIPSAELTRLGQKLRSEYGKNFLYELKFDPNLIAGCALVWNGVYKDYSLRSGIEAKKTEILSSFKQFITK